MCTFITTCEDEKAPITFILLIELELSHKKSHMVGTWLEKTRLDSSVSRKLAHCETDQGKKKEVES